MMFHESPILIVHRAFNEPTLLCRKNGGFTSLATLDCIFTSSEAWHYVNNHREDLKKFEVFVFKTLSECESFLGQTPSEIAEFKKSALVEFTNLQKKYGGAKIEKEKKAKRTSSTDYGDGLFADMGEDWESESESGQSGKLSPFDIF